jgi:hypothetical protein
MQLLSDIINELISENVSLNTILLKTKVLASRLNNKELIEWISGELNGYNENMQLPDYRIVDVGVSGDVVNGRYSLTNQQIALTRLPDILVHELTHAKVTSSVSQIEQMVSVDNPHQRLESPLSVEITSYLADNIQGMGNPYFNIIRAWKDIGIDKFIYILSSVRSKLLDAMLALEKEIGTETRIEKIDNRKIATMMNNIINNSGDGNILNTGNEVQIKATITINKGNKEQLRDKLLTHSVPEADVAELIEVVDEELPDRNGSYGLKVTKWVGRMMAKAADGSWQIGIEAAGSLIAEALKAYYGIG